MNHIDWTEASPGRYVAQVNGSTLQVMRSPDRGPDRGFISIVDRKPLPTTSASWVAAKSKAIAAVERRGRTSRREPFAWEKSAITKAAAELGLDNPFAPSPAPEPVQATPEPEPAPEPEPVQAQEPAAETFEDPLGFHPFEEIEQHQLALARTAQPVEPPADIQELRVSLSATILSGDIGSTILAVQAAAALLRELGVVVCTIDLPPRISV